MKQHYLEACVMELAFNSSHHLPSHSTNPLTSTPFNHCTMRPLCPLLLTSRPPNHFTSPSANSFTSPPQSISSVPSPSPISNYPFLTTAPISPTLNLDAACNSCILLDHEKPSSDHFNRLRDKLQTATTRGVCISSQHKLAENRNLASKLAKFRIFGEDVLRASTPPGKGDLSALPVSGMDKLKEVLLDQFPRYRRNLVEFEELWEECLHICSTRFNYTGTLYCTQVYVACKHRLQHNLYISI